MLTAEQINSIHSPALGRALVGARKIARHLHLARRTISQYLVTNRSAAAARRQRASKLDPFKSTIAEWLEQDPNASAVVVAQRLGPLGFTGGLSILKDYLHAVRAQDRGQSVPMCAWSQGRGTLRDRLGAFRCPSLPRSRAQALCLLSGRMSQPQTGLSSSRTVRVSRPSCAVTSTPSSR